MDLYLRRIFCIFSVPYIYISIYNFRSPDEELEVTSPGNRFNLSLSQRVLSNTKQAKVTVKWQILKCMKIKLFLYQARLVILFPY